MGWIHLAGLFAHDERSCACISRSSDQGTDNVCWGKVTETYPALTADMLTEIKAVSRAGALLPNVEQCDYGYSSDGDGCGARFLLRGATFHLSHYTESFAAPCVQSCTRMNLLHRHPHVRTATVACPYIQECVSVRMTAASRTSTSAPTTSMGVCKR